MPTEYDSVLYCSACDQTIYKLALVRDPQRPEHAHFRPEPTSPTIPQEIPKGHLCPGCQTPLERRPYHE